MKRTSLMVAVAVAVAVPVMAVGQPTPTPTPPDPGQTPTEPAPPPVEPDPVPPPAPAPAAPPREEPAPVETSDVRPSGFTVGIGLGYDLPADLQAPNTTSVRFRLPSGLTFEPALTAGRASAKSDNGVDEMESKDLELTVATLVRVPLWKHGRVDFEVLGRAGVSVVSDIPDGADNDTKTTTFAVSWGLGLGYWISRHWEISFSALNPLFAYSKRVTQTGPTTETSMTNTVIAAIFEPNVVLMVHLFF